MLTIQTSLFALAIGQSIISLLRFHQLKLQCQKSCFNWVLVLLIVGFVAEWLMLHPASPFKSLWLTILMASGLCLPLLANRCWQTFLKSPARGNHLDVASLILAIGLLTLMPLLMATHSGTEFANDSNPTSINRAFIIHTGMFIAGGIFACVAPCLAWQVFNQAKLRHLREERIVGYGLMLLVLTKWATYFLRILHCATMGANPGVELNVIMTIDIILSIVSISLVFSHLEKSKSDDTPPTGLAHTTTQDASCHPATQKYRGSALDNNATARIAGKLTTAVKHSAIHQNANLTLAQLAQHINEKPHYVSQVLNQSLDTNFYDWLNLQRIVDAKQKLIEQPGTGILTIAEQVGFNAKSTFNCAFRKHVGMTPSVYRKSIAQSAASPTVPQTHTNL